METAKGREIKFRAWNHIVGRMSDSYTLEQLHAEKVNFNNLILLEFTGLKDKHGVEIYEGDVVKLYNRRGLPLKHLYKVIWNNTQAAFFVKAIDVEGLFLMPIVINGMFKSIEILGNLYTNPELLTHNN